MTALRGIWVCFIMLCLAARAAAGDLPPPKKLVKQYNRALACGSPGNGEAPLLDPACGDRLMEPLSRLLSSDISDPEDLQKLHFLNSYEIIGALEESPDTATRDRAAAWKEVLVELDTRAHRVNRSFLRPSARWIVWKGKRIPAKPTPRMLEGYVEREENTVYIDDDGSECQGSMKGCEKLRYVLIQCLVPGVHDPEKARALLHAFPPVLANDRLTGYVEVPLPGKTQLCRRNYYMNPFPGYNGVMENYYEIAFADSQRVIILEQNTRKGRFIIRTDNGGVFIESPPHGVIVAMLFSGKYIMEKFFLLLVGDKLLDEPAQVLSVLRQAILHPERDPRETARVGIRDFQEKERLK